MWELGRRWLRLPSIPRGVLPSDGAPAARLPWGCHVGLTCPPPQQAFRTAGRTSPIAEGALAAGSTHRPLSPPRTLEQLGVSWSPGPGHLRPPGTQATPLGHPTSQTGPPARPCRLVAPTAAAPVSHLDSTGQGARDPAPRLTEVWWWPVLSFEVQTPRDSQSADQSRGQGGRPCAGLAVSPPLNPKWLYFRWSLEPTSHPTQVKPRCPHGGGPRFLGYPHHPLS